MDSLVPARGVGPLGLLIQFSPSFPPLNHHDSGESLEGTQTSSYWLFSLTTGRSDGIYSSHLCYSVNAWEGGSVESWLSPGAREGPQSLPSFIQTILKMARILAGSQCDYGTNVQKWCCNCPSVKTHAFHLCKHLVCNAGMPSGDFFMCIYWWQIFPLFHSIKIHFWSMKLMAWAQSLMEMTTDLRVIHQLIWSIGLRMICQNLTPKNMYVALFSHLLYTYSWSHTFTFSLALT